MPNIILREDANFFYVAANRCFYLEPISDYQWDMWAPLYRRLSKFNPRDLLRITITMRKRKVSIRHVLAVPKTQELLELRQKYPGRYLITNERNVGFNADILAKARKRALAKQPRLSLKTPTTNFILTPAPPPVQGSTDVPLDQLPGSDDTADLDAIEKLLDTEDDTSEESEHHEDDDEALDTQAH